MNSINQQVIAPFFAPLREPSRLKGSGPSALCHLVFFVANGLARLTGNVEEPNPGSKPFQPPRFSPDLLVPLLGHALIAPSQPIPKKLTRVL